jgi:uncharacterized protein HemX
VTLRSKNRETRMSEAHPDADLVKVTRTTTTYEPAAKTSEPAAVKRRNHILLWVIGVCLVVAVALAGVYYYNAQSAPAAAQNAVAANQGLAQSLTQKAATAQQQAQTAQQSADQSETNARSLAVGAVADRAAARAASRANPAANNAGSATN